MRNLKPLLAIASVFCVLLVPSRAKADSACVATTIDQLTVLEPTCTIGDKTFTFPNLELAQNGFVGLALADFEFTPDASNPLSPSFTISAAPGTPIKVFSSLGADDTLYLAYTVTVTSGSATLSGLDVSVSGSVSGGGSGAATYVEAINALSSGPGVLFTSGLTQTTDCIQNGGSFLLPGCVATNGAGAPPTSSVLFTTPVNSTTGIAIVGLTTDFTGVASLTSANYSFDEIPGTTVPEPSSFVLLATGLLGTLGVFRRKLFC